MDISRREFLFDSMGAATFAPSFKPRQKSTDYPFKHGVASGDPLSESVIIWTRITPPVKSRHARFSWQVALDPYMQKVVQTGHGYTDSQRDFTVKIDVENLAPGTTYYYLFSAFDYMSDVGRTKTLPTDDNLDHVRMAFTSCANLTRGHFNVYKELAKRADLDVILHLGDYLYEYSDVESSLITGRVHAPLHDTVTLDDYRQRHACYKADSDLQEVHRQHPFILIWDDHEIANNASPFGAENHEQGSQGDWHARMRSGVKAYLEWMPIREAQKQSDGSYKLYRSFRWGNLIDLSMLDTRLAGRDAQTDDEVEVNREQRTLLGQEQESWLYDKLKQAQQDDITWKIMGQQVMMAQLDIANYPLNHDQWDGYPNARKRLFDVVEKEKIDNWVVLTGDIHSSWAMHLHKNPTQDVNKKPLGVELVTPGVTSPGIDNYTSASLAAESVEALLSHLEFVDFYYRGYVLLDITKERMQAQWWNVDTVASYRYQTRCMSAFNVQAGSQRLEATRELSKAKASAPLAPSFIPQLGFLRRWQHYTHPAHSEGMLASKEAESSNAILR